MTQSPSRLFAPAHWKAAWATVASRCLAAVAMTRGWRRGCVGRWRITVIMWVTIWCGRVVRRTPYGPSLLSAPTYLIQLLKAPVLSWQLSESRQMMRQWSRLIAYHVVVMTSVGLLIGVNLQRRQFVEMRAHQVPLVCQFGDVLDWRQLQASVSNTRICRRSTISDTFACSRCCSTVWFYRTWTLSLNEEKLSTC